MASSQCGRQIIGATGGVCHNNAYMQMVVGPVVAAKLPRCLEHMYQASSLGTWAVEAAFAICAASVLVDDDVCVCVCVCVCLCLCLGMCLCSIVHVCLSLSLLTVFGIVAVGVVLCGCC